jgi:hypothetical protein
MNYLNILKSLCAWLPLIASVLPRLIDALEDGKITNEEVMGIVFASLRVGVEDAAKRNAV